jgi:hypothetical protein
MNKLIFINIIIYNKMNIINKIVGKDISNIVYKYLAISKDEVKINHLKIYRYLENTAFLGITYKPTSLKEDHILFLVYYKWNNAKLKWVNNIN